MAIDRFLRGVILTGIFALPVIPLIVASDLFFPFITGKNFTFRIIVEIVFASWIVLMLRRPEYRPSWTPLLIAVGAFIAIIGVADIFSENAFKSFWSNFERMEGWITLLHLFMYTVVAGTVLSSEKLWRRWWGASVAVSFVIGLVGFAQVFGWYEIHQGGVRLDATLGNATYLALYMLFHAFITLYLLVSSQSASWWMRGLYAAAFLMQIVILYLTATRGAILGFLGGILLVALIVALFEKERMGLRKAAVAGIALVVVVVGTFVAVKDTSFVQSDPVLARFSSLTAEGGLSSRLPIWNMAWQGFEERPILGWGQESFNYVFNEHYDPALYAQEPWFDRVHNIFLDWLIAGGILGLLGYLSIFLFLLLAIWSRSLFVSVTERAVLTGLLAAYSFHNLFVFDQLISYLLFFSLVAYLYTRTRPAPAPSAYFRPLGSAGVGVGSSVAALSLVAAIYFFNVQGIIVANALVEGIRPQPEGVQKNMEYYRTALSYNTVGSQEVREQAISFAIQALSSQAEQSVKQEAFGIGERAAGEFIESSPNDVRAYLFASSLYQQAGALEAQTPLLERAVELSPRKQLLLFELGANYINRGMTSEALSVFERAYELEPSYDRARLLLGLVRSIAGDPEGAEALFDQTSASVLAGEDSVLAFYIERGRYDRVLDIWLARAEQNPADPQVRISLAASYYALGRVDEAIAEVNRMIADNPSLKEQGEEVIRRIQSGAPLGS